MMSGSFVSQHYILFYFITVKIQNADKFHTTVSPIMKLFLDLNKSAIIFQCVVLGCLIGAVQRVRSSEEGHSPL